MNNALQDILAGTSRPSRRIEKVTLAEPGIVAQAVQYAAYDASAKAQKAQAEALKGALIPVIRRHWLQTNAGKANPLASVSVPFPNGGGLQVSFCGAWSPDEKAVSQLPEELTRTKVSLAIDGDAIPEATAPTFLRALMALAAEHGVVGAIKSKIIRVPVEAFSQLRHIRLSPEANEALELAGLGTLTKCKVEEA